MRYLPWSLRTGLAALSTFALLGSGCGTGSEKVPEECLDQVLPMLELPPGAGPGDAPGLEGVVTAEQRTDRLGGGAAGTVKILVFDFTTYQGSPAPVDLDGANCWRIVGQPVIDTPPTALTVLNARIEGLPGGDLDVGTVSGVYASSPQGSVLGSDDLRASWESDTSGAATFPAVDQTVPAAAPIAALETSRDALGAEMLVKWTPGDATWVQIELTTSDPMDPGNPATRNRVVCRVVDDGCQAISAGSLDWLSLNTDTASIKVERHEIRRSAPESGTLLTLETIQSEENEVALSAGLLAGEGAP